MTPAPSVAPPRFAEILLALASPRRERPFVIGDFREAFDERIARAGERRAREWYWREALRSLGPLARRRLTLPFRGRSHGSAEQIGADWLADARYALRLSRRNPLGSFSIIATMALGIASTTAVFSATHAVLLRPLPFPASERVLELNTTVPNGQVIRFLAYPDLADFRRLVPDLSDIAAFAPRQITLQHGTDPQLVQSLDVDDAYARVFGARVSLGRFIVPSDTVFAAAKVAVLSYDFWMREFGGDRSLVGHTITLDNEPVQVAGVLAPDAYLFPRISVDLLTPLTIPPTSFRKNRGAMAWMAAARLKPGASAEQAARDLASVSALLEKQYPASNHEVRARVKPVREAVVGSVRSMLELLAAAIAGVLLIASINIANLILGRAQARSREFAVRTALGGSPARVRRQVLTESLVLSSIGGVLGAALAPAITHALIAVYPGALPRAEEIGLGLPVVVVALVTTMLAGVVAAIPTTRSVRRLDLADDLRDGGRSAGGRRDRRAGRALVVTQVATSVALLFASGLLLQTFWRLERVQPGFDPRHAVAFRVVPPSAAYRSAADIERYYDDAVSAVRAIPGVRVVSTTTLLPFGSGGATDTFIQEERGDQRTNNPQAFVSISTPAFERALGAPLLRGRSFTRQDDSTSERVVMINEAAARRFYPDQDPVGRLIEWNGQPHWRIVGIVGSMHLMSLSDQLEPVLYVPAAQAPRRGRYLVVRADAPVAQVVSSARAALREIDPTIALTDIATMEQRVRVSLGAERFRAALMATLAVLALILAIVGIYGVVAYSVSRRTREIGIRMALGEASHEVRRRVVLDAIRIASAGLVAGAALALASGKFLAVFLVGVSPYDAGTLVAAAGLISTVVVAAAYGPARRAARIDPITALR